MVIELGILGVDGESHMQFITQHADAALEFLKRLDHEGSSVVVKVTADDVDAYKLLELLKQDANTRERQFRLPILPIQRGAGN